MLQLIKSLIPRPIKRLIRAAIGPRPTSMSKEDWEFDWQKTRFLHLWKQPEVRARCREYWSQYRHLDDILGRVRIDEGTDVLDVGCGLSSVLHYLPGRRVGVDPLASRYKSIYDYPTDMRILEAPGESLPFADASFDVVFSSNCIDHVTDPARMVAEIRRVLRPGGHFILTCEVFDQDIGARNEAHPHSITRQGLLDLAGGFELLEHWDSPFIGLQPYAEGDMAWEQKEHILLLKAP